MAQQEPCRFGQSISNEPLIIKQRIPGLKICIQDFWTKYHVLPVLMQNTHGVPLHLGQEMWNIISQLNGSHPRLYLLLGLIQLCHSLKTYQDVTRLMTNSMRDGNIQYRTGIVSLFPNLRRMANLKAWRTISGIEGTWTVEYHAFPKNSRKTAVTTIQYVHSDTVVITATGNIPEDDVSITKWMNECDIEEPVLLGWGVPRVRKIPIPRWPVEFADLAIVFEDMQYELVTKPPTSKFRHYDPYNDVYQPPRKRMRLK
ncbi:MAG: hypothetical protein HRU26_07125 [Psychroserpens sp.]|nr:hypothetical protein [Psychroserpens sp.]